MSNKLNAVVAVVNGQKSRTQKTLTELHHKCQNAALFAGISRRYQPKDEEGEQLPPEDKQVQERVGDICLEAKASLACLLQVVRTQDEANCKAKADVVVGNEKILSDVPVTHLLFLEKQLQDIHTFVSKLPLLDDAEQWEYDDKAGYHRSKESQTVRTKKVMRSHILYQATKEHPAQVQAYSEDVPAGMWTTVKFSGAIPRRKQREMLGRVEALMDGVKKARENANEMEISVSQNDNAVLEFVFGK
jgi:hypothetical protein